MDGTIVAAAMAILTRAAARALLQTRSPALGLDVSPAARPASPSPARAAARCRSAPSNARPATFAR